MEKIQKQSFLNIWSSAFLSFIGIGFALSLQSFDPPNTWKEFPLSHIFVLFSVFWIYSFVLFFLISHLQKIQWDNLTYNLGGDIFISLFICLLSMAGVVFQFENFSYVLFLLTLFSVVFSCFLVSPFETEIKKLGFFLASPNLLFLPISIFLRLYEKA